VKFERKANSLKHCKLVEKNNAKVARDAIVLL